MSKSLFIAVDVDAGVAAEDGVSMRWKRASDVERAIVRLKFETESGLEGLFAISAVDSSNASERAARAYLVEDSSDGVVWLIVGGSGGLVLRHSSGQIFREPYLVLARNAEASFEEAAETRTS